MLSLVVPSRTLQKIHLAVGRGSGSFEVWICEINSRKFDRANSSNPHGSVVSIVLLSTLRVHLVKANAFEIYQVTGLAWAFNGSCLYTCSQVLQFVNFMSIIIITCVC